MPLTTLGIIHARRSSSRHLTFGDISPRSSAISAKTSGIILSTRACTLLRSIRRSLVDSRALRVLDNELEKNGRIAKLKTSENSKQKRNMYKLKKGWRRQLLLGCFRLLRLMTSATTRRVIDPDSTLRTFTVRPLPLPIPLASTEVVSCLNVDRPSVLVEFELRNRPEYLCSRAV